MLRTRLWMGATLIALVIGMLLLDNSLSPWYPFVFCLVLTLALAACYELLQLLDPVRRPSAWLCYLGIVLLVLVNWLTVVVSILKIWWCAELTPWHWITAVFAQLILAAFLVEMARFQVPGHSVERVALTIWIVAYLDRKSTRLNS